MRYSAAIVLSATVMMWTGIHYEVPGMLLGGSAWAVVSAIAFYKERAS